MKFKYTKLLAASLAIITLASCSAAPKPSVNSGTSSSGAPALNTKPQTKVDELKLLSQYDNFDPNDPNAPEGEPGRILEELTGQKVNYFMLPAENSNEKLYIEISGNADYNIIKLRKDQYDTLVSQGALLDMRQI